AVAAGMIMAIDLSIRQGWIDESVRERSIELLRRAALPTAPPAEMTPEQFLETMAIDKKTVDGTIKLVLLRKLGEACVTGDYDHDKLLQTLAA
ncbi:MAG: 3-dehydroquinate synthase, partial [Gammaproteobacteria bacterium]